MPTVAEQFRSAREQLGLDIYQVAEITKIKTDHLRALESGNFDAFTAPVYIRGFARSYAKALKLDVTRLLADLDKELGQTEKFSEPPSLTGPHQGVLDLLMLRLTRLNWRILLAIAAVVLVIWGGLAVLRSQKSNAQDPLKKLGTGTYQTKSNQSGETMPLPTPPAKRP